MAVNDRNNKGGSSALVGANVGLMIALAIILTAAVQYVGYRWSRRADLTTTGINSLTPATESLLRDIDTPVTLTSLYFKTDIEDEDQDRYRSAVRDLIELYRSNNRAKITTKQINPLQDHDERKQLFKDLLELPKFKDEAAGHIAAIDNFRESVLPQVNAVIADDLAQIEAFATLEGQDERLISQVKQLYTGLQRDLEQASLDITDAMSSEVPLYSGAVGSIRQIGSTIERILNNVISVGDQIAANPQGFSPAVASFFQGARTRYGNLLATLAAQETSVQNLGQLSFDEIVRDLRADTGNALLVTTDADAKVVPFRTIWPALDPRMPAAGFKDRRFQGEQKLTSAILQLTQTEKPAVIFVRHGGTPLLSGGFMPGQPQPTYRQMKANLEDANFSVFEWDLSAEDAPPEVDPAPSRTIFVVMRPAPSGPTMPGQPPQSPPFTPQKLALLTAAMGDNPRAIFIAGFMPSMGGFPSPYEYADYLRDTWGIAAPGDHVLLSTDQFEPEKFRFVRNPLDVSEVRFNDDLIITEGLASQRITIPMASPLEIVKEQAPEGVTAKPVIWTNENPGLWSVADISYYVKQQTNEFIIRNPSDLTGEFLLAAVAEKGDGKVMVIGSGDFATDRVALASEMALTSQGLSVRPRNPANAALFINTLHWLNDNTAWMNLGTPIDTSTLAIDKNANSTRFVWLLAIILLPGLAACGGLFVWMVRRN